jgi:predicted ABC-type ATPase
MDLVAGPQGSGKSTFFPVAHRGHDSFNVDDRRRELNRGSSRKIPIGIRRRAIKEYGEFIEGHIRRGRSFAIEVTLGKEITFEQAERARRAGFRVHLTYVAAEVDDCIGRVANRVEAGGHGVSASVLRETYAASLRNLTRAVREFDLVQVYDNSRQAQPEDAPEDITPQLVLEAQRGAITFAHPRPSRWLRAALRGTLPDLG